MTAYNNDNDPRAAMWLRELIADGLIAQRILDERSKKMFKDRSDDLCYPGDALVGEYIMLIGAAGGKLADNSALVAGLKPVKRVGHDRVLLAGVEFDLVPDRIGFGPTGRFAARRFRGIARDVQENLAPAAAKRLLLARLIANVRMAMLRAGLPRPHRQFLGATPGRVDVDQNAQAGSLKIA